MSSLFGSWAERHVLVVCNKVTNATPLLCCNKFGTKGFINLCYVRLSHFYSDVIYYIKCCNTVMPLKYDPARKIVDDSGFPRTPDRLLKFCGIHVYC
jgi:hypothetical protein